MKIKRKTLEEIKIKKNKSINSKNLQEFKKVKIIGTIETSINKIRIIIIENIVNSIKRTI